MSGRSAAAAVCGAILGLALGASSAQAANLIAHGPIYRWQTDRGVVSFTDEARRIPKRYREQARTVPRLQLKNHARFTPTDPDAALRYAERLAERLERLRELNATFDERENAFAPPTDGRRQFTLRTSRAGGAHTTLDLDVDEAAGPIVVETRRLRDGETGITRPFTIVRQGDRVLSIVKPRPRVYRPGFGSLSDLEAR